MSFAAIILFDYLTQNGQWSRGILLISAFLALLVLPVWDAALIRRLIRRRCWGDAAVVFGAPDQRRRVIAALECQPELGWLPVAEADSPQVLPPGGAPLPLAIVVADPARAFGLRDFGELPFRKVVVIPNLEEAQSLWISVRDLGGIIGLEMRRNLLIPSSRVIKRALDLGVAAALALPVGAVVLAAGVALRLLSPGPVFFSQTRQGQGGRPFRMLKLRTMVPDAERRLQDLLARDPRARAEWAASMKLRHDPRIVPVIGSPLRRLSIDELPQLWNVLRGEMSLVGPRPLPDYHLAALTPDVCRLRSCARPGITGLWQVSGRSDLSLTEQQRLDVYYVRNWSLWLDIHILSRTLLVVLRGQGAR